MDDYIFEIHVLEDWLLQNTLFDYLKKVCYSTFIKSCYLLNVTFRFYIPYCLLKEKFKYFVHLIVENKYDKN